MSEAMRLAAVLLAAGKSERFGRNKLLADFKGRPMISYPLQAVSAVRAEHMAVIAGSGRIAELAYGHGFDVVENCQPELGQSHSIHLGVRYAMARNADALLLCVGDQPLLTGESLCRLMAAFAQGGKGMACLRDGTHAGNPAVFSKAYFPALLALNGDRGAKSILRAHEDDLILVCCAGEYELDDCDTQSAMASLRAAEKKTNR